MAPMNNFNKAGWIPTRRIAGPASPGKMSLSHTPRTGARTHCPYCQNPLSGQTAYCENCGVDLGLAAYLAENALTTANIPGGMPVAPELLVPRLGEYLIAKGLLNKDYLDQALHYQQEQAEKNRSILVGQALLELNLISKEKLDQAITEQILELQAALQQANKRLEVRVRERTAELEYALSKLSELNQIKSNFISNISHELRTPLTHIKGYVELLSDGSLGPVTDDQIFSLDVMEKSVDRLEALVDDLLRFSMASQGEFTVRKSTLTIQPILKAAYSQSKEKALGQEVTLEADIPESLPPVEADEEKITWVILQLLDNAIKFTNSGGKVDLSAFPLDAGVVVRVKDTGIGIPAERLEEIFEPFHQLDGSTTRRHGGTGLGMALVMRILEAHGSLPRVRSQVDAGTQVEFTLPIAKEI